MGHVRKRELGRPKSTSEDNIKTDLKINMMGWYELDSYGSE
jgi:hypothetical protein